MHNQFQEHIANMVMISKKFCGKLAPMQQYIVCLRSIEHLERVKLLEAAGALSFKLPEAALVVDFAIVSVRARPAPTDETAHPLTKNRDSSSPSSTTRAAWSSGAARWSSSTTARGSCGCRRAT